MAGLKYIDKPAYTILAGYAVLGGSGVTFAADPGTTLSGGRYGSSPTPTITGFVNGSSASTDGNHPYKPGANAEAHTQLSNLYLELIDLAGPDNFPTGPAYIFEPGVYTSLTSILFTSASTIEFRNTANVANPQWVFLSSSTIIFTELPSISYLGSDSELTGKSIYWVAGSSISVDADTTATLRGVFIAKASITFAGNRNPNPGAAYAAADSTTGAVTFAAAATMTGLGFPAICFLEDTPINTDQGILPINKIIAGVNTIDNKRIVAVTQTMDENTFLVCFKKDSLGDNVPNQDTITSRYHSVEYKGEMIEAHQFLESVENVVKLEYTGQVMYNILMDKHEKIIVNNLVCETLHPDNPYAEKYNTPDFNKISIPTTTIECV